MELNRILGKGILMCILLYSSTGMFVHPDRYKSDWVNLRFTEQDPILLVQLFSGLLFLLSLIYIVGVPFSHYFIIVELLVSIWFVYNPYIANSVIATEMFLIMVLAIGALLLCENVKKPSKMRKMS